MFRKIIKKLNNFRFTAILMACASGLAALYALGSFFLYHFAGDPDPVSKGLIRNVGFSDTPNGPYIGMVLFFAAIITLIVSLYIVYSTIPFIKNNDKVAIRKGLLLAGFISSIFELLLFVLMIILLVKNPHHEKESVYHLWKALLIVSLPFGFVSTIATGLYLVPFLKCDFYMPEIKRD